MRITDATTALLADDCDGDTFDAAREALIDADRDIVAAARLDPWFGERLTAAALAASLCPLHLIDYAICFDDDPTDCRSIRIIHPSHDT